MHTLIYYPLLQTYVMLGPCDMHDFSWRDLYTFYLPPFLGNMLKNSKLYNLMKLNSNRNLHDFFSSFPTYQCKLEHIVEAIYDIMIA